ncbi:metal-dependent hydrolase [Erythrobacter sp. Alg231-14]|uniref:metal-dependent hydrolase n=1 Tax=Erythrobacter sp. Alg231-14 TaxID=1922225 RepID=UPI000D561CAD
MDNLTHSLVGAVLGQAGLKKKTGLAMPALIIGANLPDVDAACFFWLEGVEHLGFRRGITHGPPAWVLLPLILAGLLWGYDRWQTKRGKRPEGRLPVDFKWLYLLSFIGCLSHPLFDWFNVYGIRFLEPFSSQWFYGDTLFIIDVWLWALLGFTTWFSLRREKRGGNWKRPAWIGIAVMVAYIGMNWAISHRPWELTLYDGPGAERISNPVPFYFWEREVILVGRNWPGMASEARQLPYKYTERRPMVDPDLLCEFPSLEEARQADSQLDAFLFWSRAPFATRARDGSVVLYDARFYDPRARDRFSIALPDLECVELVPE